MSRSGGIPLPLILAIAVMAFALLYAPQPLLPLFAERFGLSESRAALLITATLLPLAVAPLSYGALLQRVAPVRLLRASVAGLALSEAVFARVDSFPLLLGIRLLQGLLLPAVMTSLMTHIARSARGAELRRRMSLYIAATILGGYLGRLVSGLGAAYLGWRFVFYALAAGLAAAAVLLGRAGEEPFAPRPTRVSGAAREVLRMPRFARLYAVVFCFFFVFAALLNFVPFRLAALRGEAPVAFAGLVYTGYLFGIGTSLGSGRIAGALGGEVRSLVAGFIGYLGALAAALVPDGGVLFAALFLFCGSMFLMHAIAAAWVNQRAGERQGVVNGLYLVFYYAGGVAGSYLPGLVYERAGWSGLVGVLLAVAAVGLALALGLASAQPEPDPG
jgi:YNFM family putative membrane transporter